MAKRLLSIMAIVCALPGCALLNIAQTDSYVPSQVGVKQLATAPLGKQRFVFCTDDCPQPTKKTLALPQPNVLAKLVEEKRIDNAEIPVANKIDAPQIKLEGSKKAVVYFKFRHADLTEKAKGTLLNEVVALKGIKHVELSGFTDSVGSKARNDRIARLRVKTVEEFLKDNGVKAPIEITADGQCFYKAPNDSPANRSENRRVEVSVVVEQ